MLASYIPITLVKIEPHNDKMTGVPREDLNQLWWTLLLSTGLDKNKINIKLNIFLPINLSICFECSKEPSHRDGPFEYPQHMFWLRNKAWLSVVKIR